MTVVPMRAARCVDREDDQEEEEEDDEACDA